MSEVEYQAACEDARAEGMDFAKYVRKLLDQKRKQRKAQDLAERVEVEMERLKPKLPKIDEHDLHLILLAMMTPLSSRKLFARPQGVSHVAR